MAIEVACIARYEGRQNMVHVSALLLDGSTQEPIVTGIKTATVTLLHHDVPMLVQDVTRLDYNHGEQAFYVFFLNPPIQTNMFVRFEVELVDGQSAGVTNDVDPQYIPPYAGFSTNPMLEGRPVMDYANEDENPY